MSFLNKIHKDIAKDKEKELKELNEKMLGEFIRFQIQNNARAILTNQFSGQDLIVDLISQYSQLRWFPLEQEEKDRLNKQLAEKAGIIIPK